MKKTLHPDAAPTKPVYLERADEALKDLAAHEGVVILRLSSGGVNGPQFVVTVAQAGTMTEALIERYVPIVFREVHRQRMALAPAEAEARNVKAFSNAPGEPRQYSDAGETSDAAAEPDTGDDGE
jgi:hypothetical protein